mmetsp:Transcript_754/g.1288  ORF Transcript_754/g.1288 Transcript_754/m.1288 type:complete len:202 (-) Transcript_754:1357-1962(-)
MIITMSLLRTILLLCSHLKRANKMVWWQVLKMLASLQQLQSNHNKTTIILTRRILTMYLLTAGITLMTESLHIHVLETITLLITLSKAAGVQTTTTRVVIITITTSIATSTVTITITPRVASVGIITTCRTTVTTDSTLITPNTKHLPIITSITPQAMILKDAVIRSLVEVTVETEGQMVVILTMPTTTRLSTKETSPMGA